MRQSEMQGKVKDCRHGRLMYLLNDAYIGRSLDVYGEYSEGEIALFRQLLRPGDVAVDVGANIGALTIATRRRAASRRMASHEGSSSERRRLNFGERGKA